MFNKNNEWMNMGEIQKSTQQYMPIHKKELTTMLN